MISSYIRDKRVYMPIQRSLPSFKRCSLKLSLLCIKPSALFISTASTVIHPVTRYPPP
uniref:Uncharacterized protein n=1 Tax=Spodoptera frugiperda nuclear polyhedrosis virus TaxID=10455 RepID=A0A8F2DDS5_NPVSF|nr:hypothetical protein [Spodoptera frugiperda multiple nucleopolyhedrovirus]